MHSVELTLSSSNIGNDIVESNGKAILIAGASTGIGRATALRLDSLGYEVFAGVRRESDAKSLAHTASGRLRTILLDVTDRSHVTAALSAIDVSGVPLHGVVNNAGFNLNAAFEFTDEAKARALMETNLFGLAHVAQACLSRLRETAKSTAQTTKIVNIGSIGSLSSVPWEAWYHASKFAVLGVSESLRHEVYAHGVRVSVICPGGIKTPFIAKSRDGAHAAVAALPPAGRTLYGKGVEALGDITGQVDRLGSAPEKVAAQIERVLAQRNPPFRVIVGADAVLMNLSRTLLPTPWFHAILRRTFKC